MINKVYHLLKSIGIPLDYNFRPDIDSENTMVISYHFFGEGGLQFGDGNITAYGGSLQVDLFAKHKVDFSNVKKQIVEALTKNGFVLSNIDTEDETADGVGKIDHIVFIFNYKEREE